MEKRLLMDYITFDVSPTAITESMDRNNGKLIVQGVIQRANSLNQNKRIYPRNILEREVSKYIDLVSDRRSLGELDHPDSSVINLSNVSHLITDLWWQEDDLLAKLEILSTPSGNILKELFKSGIKIGISSRGLGSTREIGEGQVEVQDDFEILCWDMVSNPSTHGSFVEPLHEGVEPILDSKVEKYNRINEIVIDIFSSLDYECGERCEVKED